ncbi:MAG: oligopeptide:H+ symporter, partial [Sphingomonadaceae bacterium]
MRLGAGILSVSRYPAGLFYLAFTEAWERFSFYGTKALLILYMIEYLFVDGRGGNVIGLDALRRGAEALLGPISDQAFASQLFGLYAGLVYFTPIFGGLLGDRLLGQRRTVLLGAVMMAAGHLLMAWETAFVIALLLLVIGCGCLKGNISAQVGSLYAAGDPRRTDGFALFTIGINTGAFLAPILCGALAKLYGWHVGFGAAALGMAIGGAIYVAG